MSKCILGPDISLTISASRPKLVKVVKASCLLQGSVDPSILRDRRSIIHYSFEILKQTTRQQSDTCCLL